MPGCYKRSHAACKKGAGIPGEADPQCQIPVAPREVGHLGGTEEMFCSCSVTCKRSGSLCPATNAACAAKRQNITGSILQKMLHYPVKFNPLLSPRLSLASDMQHICLSCSGFGFRSSCREPHPPHRPLAPPPKRSCLLLSSYLSKCKLGCQMRMNKY